MEEMPEEKQKTAYKLLIAVLGELVDDDAG